MIRQIVKQGIIWFSNMQLRHLRTFANHTLTHLRGDNRNVET